MGAWEGGTVGGERVGGVSGRGHRPAPQGSGSLMALEVSIGFGE